MYKSITVLVLGVGIATFVFGFAAGAVLNLYLLTIHAPLVSNLRTILSYNSAIYGDGFVLPITNMLATYFLYKKRDLIKKLTLVSAMVISFLVTIYLHVTQALEGLVNWAMPTPWHWNILGLWHAIYMFVVISLVSLFYLVSIKFYRRQHSLAIQTVLVTIGLLIFYLLLKSDYSKISLQVLLNMPRLLI